jgi:hypothetical protein
VPLAGTEYVPGVTEANALEEIKTLLDRHLANPMDYLPSEHEAAAAAGNGSES